MRATLFTHTKHLPLRPSPAHRPPISHATRIVPRAISLAKTWSASPRSKDIVTSLSSSPTSTKFIQTFTDNILRPETPSTAALALHNLLHTQKPPTFLTRFEQLLLQAGGAVAPYLPSLVIPLARSHLRRKVRPFITSPDSIPSGSRNVNLLGEAVLGDREAARRADDTITLLQENDVKYVSVKVSGVTSQINPWHFSKSLARVQETLLPIFKKASATKVLINLDMEEYHDLELTIAAFKSLLQRPEFMHLDAGIVLQTYLPDALPALKDLMAWAQARPGTGCVKIRLVKGANLGMERVDAELHGWTQAPYDTKLETDANYLRCLQYALSDPHADRVRIGVASHNIFLLAYAYALAKENKTMHRMSFEMLQGMPTADVLQKDGHDVLLYTPVCHDSEFDAAIAYLFRRFDEASSNGNFLHSLPGLVPGSEQFKREEIRFRTALAMMDHVSEGPRRKQERPATMSEMTRRGLHGDKFFNEPDTDPSLSHNRAWAMEVIKKENYKPPSTNEIHDVNTMAVKLETARRGSIAWGMGNSNAERRAILTRLADSLARRRGELINAMVHEGKKTFPEADAEVSEAIDFAHYYAMSATSLPETFRPFGVVSVISPWNFPVAITSGGVIAALAAGNSVILKPSPETPRCAELVAECCWEAGVPHDALQFVNVPENDVGKMLVVNSDAVILTGSSETAALFRSWKPDMRLFAETSGKNSLVISPAADLDLAVADLVNSAFSNSGQKCSASSLAICVGDVYDSRRFLNQLQDSVESLEVGDSSELSSVVGPLISAPDKKLERALTTLDDGEEWLVKPKCLDEEGDRRLWTPGVRLGVTPGSWFHQNEVFGPVLGIMKAETLEHALEVQNGTKYGLTGGFHSLNNDEIEDWVDKVQVGNAYVNRGITGAMVQRQSFGGWKSSVVGPGAKAGGPNYVMQLGTILDDVERDEAWLHDGMISDQKAWTEHFSKEHDPSGLACQTNVFRYRPLPRIVIRVGPNANMYEIERVRNAIDRCEKTVPVWSFSSEEDVDAFVNRLPHLDASRVRVIGDLEDEVSHAASAANIHVASDAVVADGRVELLHYLREQCISRTRHRFGSLEKS